MEAIILKVETPYLAPRLEVMEFKTEKGFAQSNDWDELGFGGGMGEWD